jgi:flagellar protein FlgJ
VINPLSIENSVLPQVEQSRLTQLSNLAGSGGNQTNEELKSVAHEFESIFVHQLLKSMRSTVQKTGLLDSHATQMYESLYDEEVAKLMTEQRSMGLADIVYRDLVRLEEKSSKARSTSGAPVQKLTPAIDLHG